MAGQNMIKTMGMLQTSNSLKTMARNSSNDKGFKTILDSNSNLPEKGEKEIDNSKLNQPKQKNKIVINEPKQRESLKNNKSSESQSEPLETKEVELVDETIPYANIQNLEKAIKESILEILDISEEELEVAMSELGIGLQNLLVQDNLKDLILKVNNTDDMLQFVTNSDMTNQLNQLTVKIQNIKDEFGISEKDIQSFILNQVNLNQETALTDVAEDSTDIRDYKPQETIVDNEKIEEVKNKQLIPEITDEVKQPIKNEVTTLDKEPIQEISNKDIPKEYTPNIVNNEITNNVAQAEEVLTKEKIVEVNQQHILPNEVKVTNETINEIHKEVEIIDKDFIKTPELAPKEIKIEVSTNNLKESNSNSDGRFQESNQESNDNRLDSFVNNLVQNISNDQEDINLNQIKQFREIINQIVEQIKIAVKPDTSSMEIQLNPEHLGKINLQIVAKDGVLSAQFTAQTQIAKEAIESQIMTLKENLNNQGLKVEAIEVTVASSGFSQSNQTNSSNQGESKQPKRKLSMEQINALMGADLTDEEKIAVDIMRQNGSSIDYTA